MTCRGSSSVELCKFSFFFEVFFKREKSCLTRVNERREMTSNQNKEREELPNERREMTSNRNKEREELPNERREMTSRRNKDREELLEDR
jgi:hypothetical protein